MSNLESLLRSNQVLDQNRIVAREGQVDVGGQKASSVIGRLAQGLERIRSSEVRQRNVAAIESYLSELGRTDPALAEAARSRLQDRLASGKPVTIRKLGEIGGDALLGVAQRKAGEVCSVLRQAGVTGTPTGISPNESQRSALDGAIRSLQLVLAHVERSGNQPAVDALMSSLREVHLLAGLPPPQRQSGTDAVFVGEGSKKTLAVFNPSLDKHVKTKVDARGMDALHHAWARSKAGESLGNDSSLRRNALDIIKASGEGRGLRLLNRAPLEAVVDLAIETVHGEFSEFEILHKVQLDLDAKVLDAEGLSLLKAYNEHQKDWAGKIVDEAVEPAKTEPAKAPERKPNPDVKQVRAFFAELIYPGNPAKLESEEPGARVKQHLTQNTALLVKIMAKPELLEQSELPKQACDQFKAMLEELKPQIDKLGGKDDTARAARLKIALTLAPASRYTTIAREIDDAMNDLDLGSMGAMSELSKVARDAGSGPMFEFLGKVFDNYCEKQTPMDRRAMVASYLREAAPDDQAAHKLVSMLKGAGPYLLKMLQLFGDNVGDPQLKSALNAVKSELAPIAVELRNAQFSKIIQDSGGKISSLQGIRSLGAASVGQTFLAKAVDDKGKDVEVVVKLLRPGIVERAARERRFMESVAQGIPGMEATFAGIADQIEGELDLRNEAANVRKGDIYNHIGSEDVRAMKLMESVPESSTYMVIERAPGSPMSKYIKLCADPKVKLGFDPVVMGPRMAQQLYDLSSKWFEEAMFGSGFYHGDLHAGNIMFDGDAHENGLLTAIDFGNAKTLSQEERSAIFKLMVAIEIKDSKILLQHFRTLLSPQSQAKLTPELEARFTAEADKLLRGPKAATGGDAMVKVLTMANNLGLEMPGAISNFSRSQVMLENALSEIVGHNTRNWRTAADDKTDAPDFIKRNTVTFHESIDRQASKLESTGKSEDRAVAYALRACKMVEFADLNQTQRDLLTQYVPNDYKAVSHFHAKLHRQVSDDPPPVLTMGDAILDVLSRHKWDAAKLAGLGNSLVALVKSRFTPDEVATTPEQPQAQKPVTPEQLV